METALILFVVTATLIAANGIFVAAEFSSVHVRRARIGQHIAAGNRFARLFETIVSDPRRFEAYVAGCQIGVTLSSILLGLYGQAVITNYIHPLLVQQLGAAIIVPYSLATIVVLFILIVFQMVLGEIIPRAIALRYAEETVLFIILPMHWAIAFFRPAMLVFNKMAAFFLHMFGVPPIMQRYILSPEEIEYLAIESAQSGLIEADEHQLLHNVFRAAELTASRIMVPRTRLVAASKDTPLLDLLELATSSGHTRIPLYQESIDTIVGSVHLKDLFRLFGEEQDNSVHQVLRPTSYVSEHQPALSVWNQLRQDGNYIAIVLDEFGGTAGMITVGDLLEELFGELQDEFDDNKPDQIIPDRNGCSRLQGDVRIDDVNERFDLKLPTEEVTTIGGLIMASLERLPQVGDTIPFEQVTLRVEAVNGPSILEVCLIFAASADEERSTDQK